MDLKRLTAHEVRELMNRGATLVDIREQDEFARERIPGAKHIPLTRFLTEKVDLQSGPVIFHCKGGTRTRMNAGLLARAAGPGAAVLEGGIEAWKSAGFTTA